MPVSPTFWVLGVALSTKLSEADSAEAVDGLKVSVIVQLPPATTGVPTLHDVAMIAKSPLFGPLIPGALVKFSGAVPVFISVTIIEGLVTPCVTDPNPKLAGKLTAGAVPVPLSATLCDAGVALSAKFSDALSPVIVEGEKVRVTTQLLPAATCMAVEQVLDTMVKSAALVPVSAGFAVNISGALPEFINATVI